MTSATVIGGIMLAFLNMVFSFDASAEPDKQPDKAGMNFTIMSDALTRLSKADIHRIISFVPSYENVSISQDTANPLTVADIAAAVGGQLNRSIPNISVISPKYLPDTSPDALTEDISIYDELRAPELDFLYLLPDQFRPKAISPGRVLLSELPDSVVANLKQIQANRLKTFFDIMYGDAVGADSGFEIVPALQVNVDYGNTPLIDVDLWNSQRNGRPQWNRGADIVQARSATAAAILPDNKAAANLSDKVDKTNIKVTETIASLTDAARMLSSVLAPMNVIVDKRIAERRLIITPGLYTVIDVINGISTADCVQFRVVGNILFIADNAQNVKNLVLYKSLDQRVVDRWAVLSSALQALPNISSTVAPFRLTDFATFGVIPFKSLDSAQRTYISQALESEDMHPNESDLGQISVRCELGITVVGVSGNLTTRGIGTTGFRYSNLGLD